MSEALQFELQRVNKRLDDLRYQLQLYEARKRQIEAEMKGFPSERAIHPNQRALTKSTAVEDVAEILRERFG